MKQIKKFISMFLCCIIIAAVFTSNGTNAFAATTDDGEFTDGYFNQRDAYWKDKRHPGIRYDKNGKLIKNSMYDAGCGIISFCNAIHALNIGIYNAGQVLDVAQWAYDKGYYTPGNGGLSNAGDFYKNIEAKYGSTYHFKIGSLNKYGLCGTISGTKAQKKKQFAKLYAHLQNDSVATCHISGHYICLVGYNPNNDKFHVIESYVQTSTDTNHPRYNNGLTSEHSYVTTDQLISLGIDKYWIIEPYLNGTFESVAKTKMMLNVNGSSSATGTAVSVYEKDCSLGQDFRRIYKGNNKWQIVPLCATSNCLKADGRVHGVPVVSGKASTDDTCLWYIEQWAGHKYIIRASFNRNLVLTATGTSNRSPVLLTGCTGLPTASQLWDLGA